MAVTFSSSDNSSFSITYISMLNLNISQGFTAQYAGLYYSGTSCFKITESFQTAGTGMPPTTY